MITRYLLFKLIYKAHFCKIIKDDYLQVPNIITPSVLFYKYILIIVTLWKNLMFLAAFIEDILDNQIIETLESKFEIFQQNGKSNHAIDKVLSGTVSSYFFKKYFPKNKAQKIY